MATQLQFRRGTSSQNDGYTGLVGEITLDTDTNNIRIHDGSTAGGNELVPAGTIVAYGAATAPEGWLLCDNSAVSRTTYARLFAVISTAYGTGDGSSTFNVPDFRDKVPLGKGTNNDTLGDSTSGASASAVMTSSTKNGVTTASNNTGTGTTGSTGGSTVANNTGTGTSGGSGVTITGSTANSQATTVASNTGADGAGDLTVSSVNRNDTLGSGTKDVTQRTFVSAVNQTNHTHTIPSLTVNNHTHGAGNLAGSSHTHSVPSLSIPSLTVNGHTHSIPALSIPSLSVNGFTVSTTLPSEVVNYIIKV